MSKTRYWVVVKVIEMICRPFCLMNAVEKLQFVVLVCKCVLLTDMIVEVGGVPASL